MTIESSKSKSLIFKFPQPRKYRFSRSNHHPTTILIQSLTMAQSSVVENKYKQMNDTGKIYSQVAACSKVFDDIVLWRYHVKTEHPASPAINLSLIEQECLQRNLNGTFRCKVPNCNKLFMAAHPDLIKDGMPVASGSTPLAVENVDKGLEPASTSYAFPDASSSVSNGLDGLTENPKRGKL